MAMLRQGQTERERDAGWRGNIDPELLAQGYESDEESEESSTDDDKE